MEQDLLQAFSDDDIFKQFLEENFDAKAYATHVIQGLAISQQLSKLAEGITLLDKDLHSQVVHHHEDLLSQATGIETLEDVLHMMHTRIQSLMAAIERIRSRVTEPYNKIISRTSQLRRLQETCDLLRRIIRIMYLSKRLHGQLKGGTREITKAAQSLNELDYLSGGVDLSGIEVVEQDRRFIKLARKEVEEKAQRMLEQGMESQNQSQAATALQVFHNLNTLEVTVDAILADCQKNLLQSIRTCLDIQTSMPASTHGKGRPGSVAMPGGGNTAQYRASLWTNMEKLMDGIYSSYAQALHLQKVLVKKRDPVTHVCFIEHLAKAKDCDVNLLQDFWRDVTSMLSTEFSTAAGENTFLKQAFEGEYPKLLRLYNDLWRRIQGISVTMPAVSMATSSHTASPGPEDTIPTEMEQSELFEEKLLGDSDFDPEKALRSSLHHFERAYLSKSLSRLFDPINLVFSSSSANPPTQAEIDNISRTISSELNVASIDAHLSATIAKNIAKTIKLYTVKSEQLLVTDGEGSQVIGPPTAGQTLNAEVVNSLFKFHQAVTKAVESLNDYPAIAISFIQEALESVVEMMGSAIQPLFSSISDALEAIILTIHQEDFSLDSVPEGGQSESQCSLYMRELQQFILRVQSTYFVQFECQDFIMDSVHLIAVRCLDLFVRHASLIRPLGEGGKMRLAADFAQMEMGIMPFCRKVGDLGKAYRQLRSFRPLLFQTPEHIASSPAVGEIIPYSLILHYLFSRGPPELKPPHEAANWSFSRYTQWLDDHTSEKDRLTFIKGSLESYVQYVTSRGGKEFASVYPIMLDVLQRGLKNSS
ncbi:hypothetical protein CAPTEDRAFT_226404 [Capitella teleta]|uniref:Conserved oligomeric Golgi complex subunit 5 n=1 Tax=Capitella teleta TaxID=283909 RepID=R7T7K1_CAPTE|nr:hypothetical protein CAPTEDRAFT_226404 [Capitella teleta]|eukprot:ELT89629.1 hypothetical protein CAPTEDRAFT_226404 [Capitella teleta]